MQPTLHAAVISVFSNSIPGPSGFAGRSKALKGADVKDASACRFAASLCALLSAFCLEDSPENVLATCRGRNAKRPPSLSPPHSPDAPFQKPPKPHELTQSSKDSDSFSISPQQQFRLICARRISECMIGCSVAGKSAADCKLA